MDASISDRERMDSPDDEPNDLEDRPHESEDGPIPGENPDDDVLPISPTRRRIAMWTGIVFLFAILAFLFWFVTTHREQSGGGMLGHAVLPPGMSGEAVASGL